MPERKSKYPWLSSKLQNERLALHFTYLKYNYNISSMIYTTNWIERLNKTFKKSLKVRGALAGLVLLWCRHGNELLQLPNYSFCSRATTLSVGLALKCDETEAGRSENTLQNVKNYKITRKCQKKYIFAQTIFTHF